LPAINTYIRRSSMRRVPIAMLIVMMLLSATLPLQAREGFGMSKRAVKLDRRVPPDILLVADTIDVRLDERADQSSGARRLREIVEDKMTSYDSRLVIEREQPSTLVILEVGEITVDESWRQKRESEYRQTGTKTETDKNGKTKTVPVYGTVLVDVNYKDVTGRVTAGFRLVDQASGEEIYADTSTSRFSESYKLGDGAPMQSELERTLIDQTASKISGKLVGAIDTISVLVPRGSFDRLVAVAEGGNWESYLRSVEAIPPPKRPTDEAYREYALGVATEALAYAAATEVETLELLRAAADHYGRATTMNPREKLFLEGYTSFWYGTESISPQERVRTAMADYERLAEYRVELAAGRTPRRAGSTVGVGAEASRSPASPPPPPASGGERLTNASIVALATAGLADDNIILAIDSAAGTDFDLTTEGLVSLARAGVSPAVVAHMQKTRR
jgi:hypothetical protein